MEASRILIIENDVSLSAQVAQLLQDKGFSTHQCHDGEQGLLTALQQGFDLILLDVLLPGINGFSILQQLRKVKQTPVMMVTAKGAEQERIQGYSTGADDYLPKPFSFAEMLVRIEALLRRSIVNSKPSIPVNKLSIDQLQLDRNKQHTEFAGNAVSLTPIQFKLLWVLLENRHQVLSKPFLYQTVLDKPFSRYDRSLDMHLSRVRKKLEEVGMPPDRLATVHGKGYRFS